MIIRLKANFSENNIGELNKFNVNISGSKYVSHTVTPTPPIDKGANATIIVTAASGTVASDFTVTMKGNPITPSITETSTGVFTITITNVTGTIGILVGEVVSGGGDNGETTYSLADFMSKVGIQSGLVKYDGTTYSLSSSTAWSYCIFPLSTYNVTYATVLTGKEGHNGGVAPILFLSSGTLAQENIVGFLVGDQTNDAITNDAFRIYDGDITPPVNATHMVICDFNNHSGLGDATVLDALLKVTVS